MTPAPSPVRFLVPVLVLCLAACGGRSIGSGNENTNQSTNQNANQNTNAIGGDAGVMPGGQVWPEATVECPVGRKVVLEAQALSTLRPIEGTSVREGLTIRIAVAMTLPACHRFAQVTYTVDPKACHIEVGGWVFAEYGPDLPCASDEPETAEEILAFPLLHACVWTVEEHSGGAPGRTLTFTVIPCPADVGCICENDPSLQREDGTECFRDCECASGQCLTHTTMGGVLRTCGRSCSVAADCGAWEICLFNDEGQWAVCRTPEETPSCDQLACPAGFTCDEWWGGGYCHPVFPLPHGEVCACDAECVPGQRCVASGIYEVGRCEATCRGDFDCPQGWCGADDPGGPRPYCVFLAY